MRRAAGLLAALVGGCFLSLSVLSSALASTGDHSPVVDGVVSGVETAEKDLPPEPVAAALPGAPKRGTGEQFVAVTANPYATTVASEILAAGGTAVDAAIAGQMVLGLVEPQSSGIGGGGFLLHWRADRRQLASYDGRETAPLAADGALFIEPDSGRRMGFFDAAIGGRSVGVPGLLAMLGKVYAEHGSLPWPDLFQPAIDLAEKGFIVSPRLAQMISDVPRLGDRAALRGYLFSDTGHPLESGDRVTNSAYAAALRQVASDGGESFYRGEMAAAMAAAVNNDRSAGALSLEDFSRYRPLSRPPLCRAVFSYRVCGMGPPSSGASTVLSILGALSQLEARLAAPRDAAGGGVAGDLDRAHYFLEASRLAFADRNTYIADPDFVAVPLQQLLEPRYLSRRAAQLRRGEAMSTVSPGRLFGAVEPPTADSPERDSTTHISIVDQYGNIVSMTSSIESAFGSRLWVDGFILNNQLTDFSFVPRQLDGVLVANRVEGGKRPRSSMSPMIIFDASGEPVMAIGSPGGKRIIPYVARVLYEVLVMGRPLGNAVDGVHILHIGSHLEVEEGVPESVLQGLRLRGHTPLLRPQASGIHALIREGRYWHGVADPRREGAVDAR